MALTPIVTPTLQAMVEPASADEYAAGQGSARALMAPLGPALRSAPAPAPVGFDFNTRKVFVNGLEFDADDHRSALISQEYLDKPEAVMPANFTPLQPEVYRDYVKGIKDPSYARLFAKNFGIGVDATQMLLYGAAQAAGRGLGLKGVEDFGAQGVERNVGELSFNEPYQRRATDIEGVGDAGEWFVANLGQLAPSIVEAIAAAGIGALVGTATGGVGFGTVGGAALGVGAKNAVKTELKARVREAMAKRAAGEEFDRALLRKVGAAGGGALGAAVNSYALGVGDVFTEGEAQGEGDVAKALLYGLPYAASELLPQFLAVSKLAKGFKQGVTTGGRTRRALAGGTGGIAAEGGTEAAQELLVLGATGQLDFSNPEVTDRLIDAFAAGAGVGGPLGFVGGAMGRTIDSGAETNVLTREEVASPTTSSPGGQGELFPGRDLGVRPGQGELFPAQDMGGAGLAVPSGQQYDLFRRSPSIGGDVGQQLDLDFQRPDTAGLPLFDYQVPTPAVAPAVQGEFGLQGGRAVTPAPRPVSEQFELPLEDTRQLSLDLAEQPGTTRTDTAIAQAFERAREAQAQAQQQAPTPPRPNPLQRQAITPQDIAFQQAEAQRRQQLLADQEAQFQQVAAPTMQQPAVVAPPAAPVLPGLAPSYGEKLRKRREPTVIAERRAPADVAGRPDTAQGEMFLRRGGKRTAPPPTAQANQQPAIAEADEVARQKQEVAEEKARKLVSKKLARLAQEPREISDVQEDTDAVQERSAAPVDVREPARPRGGVRAGDVAGQEVARESKAGTKAEALKRGREAQSARSTQSVPAQRKKQQPADVKHSSVAAAWDTLRRQATEQGLGVYQRAYSALANTANGREVRATWDKAFKANPALTVEDFDRIAENLETTPREDLTDAQFTLGENPTVDQFREAVRTILDIAVMEGGHQDVKLAARDFLLSDDERIVGPAEQSIIADAIAAEAEAKANASERGLQLQAGPVGSKVPTTRLLLLRHYGKLQALIGRVRFRDLPNDLADAVVSAAENDMNRQTQTTKSTTAVVEAVEAALNRVAKELMKGVHKDNLSATTGSLDIKNRLKKAGIDYDYIIRGEPLRSWLNDKRDNLNWVPTDSSERYFKVEAKDRTTLTLDELMAEIEGPAANGRTRRVSTGEEIIHPMSMGAVKMFVQKARRAFAGAKPKIYVFKNLMDLQRRAPGLYAEAAARRTAGDFDSIRAAGYAYDDKVFIFSDHVKDRQELTFTLAHEVLGHMGMRAVFGAAEFRQLMDQVYDISTDIRQATDGYIEVHGTDKYEAIEEAIADYAAWLDNSILGLLRKAFRGFFNRLGFKFDDDMLRYMVAQSRRYLRTGERSSTSSPVDVLRGLRSQEEKFQEGRFHVATSDLHSVNWLSQSTYQNIGEGLGLSGKIARARSYLKTRGVRDLKTAIGYGVEHFQSMANMSGRSFGLRETFKVFQDQTHFVRSTQSQVSQRLQLTHRPAWQGGPSEAQRRVAGDMLAYWALHSSEALTEQALRAADPIIKLTPDGQPIVDYRAYMKAQAASGIVKQIGGDGTKPEHWEVDIEGLKAQMAAGLRFPKIGDDGNPVLRDGHQVYEAKQFTNIEGVVMTLFLENRDAVNFAAQQQVLAKMKGFHDYRTRELENMAAMTDQHGRRMGASDVEFLNRVTQHYQDLYNRDAVLEGEALKHNLQRMREANEWLGNVTYAMRSDIKFEEWEKAIRGQDIAEGEITQVVLDNPGEYRWVVDGLREIRKKDWSKRQTLAINKALAYIHLISTQAVNADLYARRTIMGAYVPFSHKGKYQVKIVALDADGNEVRLSGPLASSLPYFKMNNKPTMEAVADDLRSRVIGSLPDEITITNEDGSTQPVTLEVRYGEAPDIVPLHETVNYDEFVQTLTRLGVGLSPQERETVVEALTASHSTARKNLMRTATPGWDPDILGSTAEHLEMVAHIAGKNRYRHRLRQILDRYDYWDGAAPGARERLKTLQDTYAAALATGNDGRIHNAHKALAEYQRMMVHMSEEGVTVGVMDRTGKMGIAQGLGQGKRYRNEALRLVDFYDNSLDIMGDPVNKAVNEASGFIMSTTAAMQLGMSIATAGINLGSLGTHAVPYLAAYNPELGYGGGFGMAKATAAVLKASRQMALNRRAAQLADPTFLAGLERGQKYKEFGLSRDEYDMLLELTREGVLQANMFNAMIGATRESRKFMGPFLELWMKPFTFTEQLNRRATALATYRLEYDRMVAQGLDPKSDTSREHLYQAVTNAVNFSQGEYAHYNRPGMARNNITQFLFMYKQFVVITIENLRNMGLTQGTAAALAMLMVLAGAKGMPFGEDLMDLVDVLAQKFGIRMKPVEMELAEAIDHMLPGAAPFVLHGVANYITGAMVSSRIGLGDLIPLTGAGKAGADPWREAGNFFGPVYSSVTGTYGLLSGLIKYGAEVVGLREDTTDLRDLLRDQPAAGLRAAMDTLSYALDGKITNARGQVVSKDAPLGSILARMLGFYPKVVADQYAGIRLGRQMDEYAKALKVEFTNQYARAKNRGDHETVRDIQRMVQDWNTTARGTPFYFANFTAAANRVAKEAGRSAVDRYLKSAPKATRLTTKDIVQMYGLGDQGELVD